MYKDFSIGRPSGKVLYLTESLPYLAFRRWHLSQVYSSSRTGARQMNARLNHLNPVQSSLQPKQNKQTNTPSLRPSLI